MLRKKSRNSEPTEPTFRQLDIKEGDLSSLRDAPPCPVGLRSPHDVFLPPRGTKHISWDVDPDNTTGYVFYFTGGSLDDIEARRVHAMDIFAIPDTEEARQALVVALQEVCGKSIRFYGGTMAFGYDRDYPHRVETFNHGVKADRKARSETRERTQNMNEKMECFFSMSREESTSGQASYFDNGYVQRRWHEGFAILQDDEYGLLELVPQVEVRELDIDWETP